MNANDKQYKALTLRLGFALLFWFVLLQGSMTVLSIADMMFESVLSEKAGNLFYWGFYNVFYFASFMLPVPIFMLMSKKIPTQPMFFDLRLPRHFLLSCVAGVGMITAVGQINSLLVAPFMGESNESTDMLLELIKPGNGYMVVLVFVMLVIVPPICEEFLFRGLVLGNLLPYGKGVAIVGSALMFAAMHQSYTQFLYTAMAGVLLGILYVKSRSIWPPTILHMLNNLVSFVQMVIMARISDEMLANRIVIAMNLFIIFAGLVAFAILVLLARRKEKVQEIAGSAFGTTPEKEHFEQPVRLSDGMAVKGFFSPSIAVFICLSIVMAVFGLIMEHVA